MSTALVELLSERRKSIIDRFFSALRQRDLPSDNLPSSALVNTLPLFLEELTHSMRDTEALSEESITPREHGEQRWVRGFDLSALVREYGVLHRCMLEEADAASLVISNKEFVQLANCINVGIAEAVKEFTRLEAKRRDELSQSVKESGERADTSDHALHDFVENLADLAWSARPDGYIDFFNRRWYEYTGTSFDEVKGWGWEKVHEGTLLPEVVTRWRLSLTTLEPFEMEHQLRSAAGHFRWFLTRAHPLRDRDGNVTRWFGTSTDIDDRRQAELDRAQLLEREQRARRDAERLNRLKDEFLATVSHELRTPLQAMMGWAHILRNENVDREQLRKGLETIERNAKAQSQLIDDILDVSSIIAGKVRIRADTFDVASVIEAALKTVRPASRAKGVEVVSNLPLDSGSMVGDADRLQQVVWNLLSNAVKFTPRGGKVTIGVHRRDSQLAITVSDTGNGISEEFLPSVFERFRQADSGSNRTFGGLGLGLAIVRHLVELHGGTVEAASAGEGKGSTFVVQLPIRATGITREELESLNASQPPLRRVLDGIRVLVVDDEADARELLVLIIKEYGAEAVQASSARDALAQLQQGTFDVLVSDIGMPGEDGYVLIRQVRALGDIMRSGIPALALTAYARAEDRRRALGAGFQMHIAKPMDADRVIAAIAQLAERGPPALNPRAA